MPKPKTNVMDAEQSADFLRDRPPEDAPPSEGPETKAAAAPESKLTYRRISPEQAEQLKAAGAAAEAKLDKSAPATVGMLLRSVEHAAAAMRAIVDERLGAEPKSAALTPEELEERETPAECEENLRWAEREALAKLKKANLDPALPATLLDVYLMREFTWLHSKIFWKLSDRIDTLDRNIALLGNLKKQLESTLKSVAPKATKARKARAAK